MSQKGLAASVCCGCNHKSVRLSDVHARTTTNSDIYCHAAVAEHTSRRAGWKYGVHTCANNPAKECEIISANESGWVWWREVENGERDKLTTSETSKKFNSEHEGKRSVHAVSASKNSRDRWDHRRSKVSQGYNDSMGQEDSLSQNASSFQMLLHINYWLLRCSGSLNTTQALVLTQEVIFGRYQL